MDTERRKHADGRERLCTETHGRTPDRLHQGKDRHQLLGREENSQQQQEKGARFQICRSCPDNREHGGRTTFSFPQILSSVYWPLGDRPPPILTEALMLGHRETTTLRGPRCFVVSFLQLGGSLWGPG